mmetsp:Transcript_34914/g.31439  ORF Transcript_34914/g.31439 Transcript_34914/m.31439 type:complete len:187 (-) Transcript_34914:156-716(-)
MKTLILISCLFALAFADFFSNGQTFSGDPNFNDQDLVGKTFYWAAAGPSENVNLHNVCTKATFVFNDDTARYYSGYSIMGSPFLSSSYEEFDTNEAGNVWDTFFYKIFWIYGNAELDIYAYLSQYGYVTVLSRDFLVPSDVLEDIAEAASTHGKDVGGASNFESADSDCHGLVENEEDLGGIGLLG